MDIQKFYDLQDLVIDWGTQRNFYDGLDGTTPEMQFLKLIEEFGELAGGIARANRENIKDAIGDVIVVSIGMLRLIQDSSSETLRPFISDKSVFTGDIVKKMRGLLFDLNSLCFDKGDILTFNVIITAMIEIEADFGFQFCECLEHSYNEIKDRKGKMINRVYIKEADLAV